MEEKLVKVLWVENDPSVINAYPLEAENYGIELHPFDCWDDARNALLADYDSWDAIILDGKCKHHRTSADNATRFLIEVFTDLEGIFREKKRYINWYVLSGELGKGNSELIPERREKWDGDWKKSHYDKITDRTLLFQRVRLHVKRMSFATQLKTILYKEVFNAIRNCKLDEDVDLAMVELLTPMHFPDSISCKGDYNNRLHEARLVLEYVFRSMISNGILPPTYRTLSASKDVINESWCSLMLAGIPDPRSKTIATNGPIAPKIICENIKNILYVTGSSVHTSEAKQKTERNFKEYLKDVQGSTFLIQSFALQLCDLILWYNRYLSEHPDKEANSSNWSIIESETVSE